MKRIIGIWTIILCMIPTFVSAHVMNESSVYGDIGYSEAADEILFLSGMGIIFYEHGDALFKPTDMLQRGDLAAWAGNFFQLGSGGESVDELKNLALQANLVSSMTGNATYHDVNRAFFNGKVKLQNPDDELKREQFALFMFEHLLTELEDGKTLYDVAGYVQGPSGVVEEVRLVEEQSDSGFSKEKHVLVIDDEEYTLAAHPRVTRASVDPAIWEGKQLEQSWLTNEEGEMKLQQLVFAEGASVEESEEASAEHHDHVTADQEEKSEHAAAKAETEETVIPWGFIGVIVLTFVIIAIFLVKKKKQNE